ncbi:MAG: toprim domain-containing protein, partial [Bacteroidales bacterium]
SPKREAGVLCVVSDIRDVLAVENTGFYKGLYHVLGGLISPIEGVSPSQLNIQNLLPRIETESISEIILALPATPDGDTTAFYIAKALQNYPVLLSCIAKGIAFGDDLEYTDELTLGRSIANRLPFK